MSVIQVEYDNDDQIKVSFAYSTETVAKIRSINGRKWDQAQKVWFVPNTAETVERLKEVLTKIEV